MSKSSTMKYLFAVIFTFVMITSPFVAHHAAGEAMREHIVIASFEDQGPSSQCDQRCEEALSAMCCSQAVTHCSPTFNHNNAWTEYAPIFTALVSYPKHHDPLAQLMFEAETPPPRV